MITGGRSASGDTPSPATCTLTVNNRDGRFSPNYSGGAYFPYLQRNVKIRVSLSNATSASGNLYSGYRFWGEVSAWPPLSDISAKDVYVQVSASGPLRRIRKGGGKGSALTRYYASLTGLFAPIAYWPCEEDPDTTIVGPGIDGGTNMTVITGTPKWKAVSSFNGSGPIGVLNNSTWDGLTGAFGSSGNDNYTTPGTYTWVSPVTAAQVRVWAPGGGGGGETGGGAGGGGGGGEEAEEAALALTVGAPYTFKVLPGGVGGRLGADGADGGIMTFAGDAVTVTAHGGKGGKGSAAGGAGGLGGTGSANGAHRNGGAGGAAFIGGGSAGGGGGGSGGTAAAGNAGANGVAFNGGNGATAVTGGGPGGKGSSSTADGSPPATGPGGGGGGGGAGGGNGFPGKVQLVYTPPAGPASNVLRFILYVPPHGGNRSKVLVRAVTGGTVARLDVALNATSTGLVITGYNSGFSQLFTGTLTTPVNGQTLLVSAELATSGANVAWKLTAIKPGVGNKAVGSASGTQNVATIGNVTEVLAGPNADITKTAIGHISVQYALVDITQVSAALDGNSSETGIDRFIRLCNEQALDNVAAEFAEAADHWGFEGWTFTTFGTPIYNGYFIVVDAQAAQVQAGDVFTSSNNGTQQFTVTGFNSVAGLTNVFFTPTAASNIANPATVTSFRPAWAAPGTQSWVSPNAALLQSAVTAAGWPTEGTHSLRIMTSFLSGDASDFEGGIANWTGAGNANVARTFAQALDGAASMSITSIAAGNADAGHCLAANIATQGLACAAGNVISCSAWFRAAVSARTCKVGADFYTAAGVYISTPFAAFTAADTTTGWTQVSGTVTAPATAAFCRLHLQNTATGAANEVHYAERCAISNDSTLTQWYAGGPTGLSGQPVVAGDLVSAAADVYAPAALGAVRISLDWYVAAGTFLSTTDGTATTVGAGAMATVMVSAQAPATAAFFRTVVKDSEASSAGTLMYADHVRVSPQMGPQTRKEYHLFLQEIEDLDQGILKEAKTGWTLGYRTRIALINQSPAVTLDFSAGEVSPPLAPVVDDMKTVNDVTVKRHKGSTAHLTLDSGTMSTQEPPAGAGRMKRALNVVAKADAQLLALAQHLLNLGTVTDERYPTISVNLARANIAGNNVAPLMSAMASVEVGDRVKIISLPFWFPSATVDQIVLGYTENLGPRQWDITWNCAPMSPYLLAATSIRRW